jgi:diaminopimelate decarboxylase
MGAGFDVVSGGELSRVLRLGRRTANHVVFSGVGKTAAEIVSALKAGILFFNVESGSELAVLADCASRVKRRARVALRINPNVSAKTHPHISTGLHRHKFGIPLAVAPSLYEEAARSPHLEVAGISVHIGSQILDIAPFQQTMENVAKLVHLLRGQGHRIEFVDAGGGLGIDYDNDGKNFGRQAAAYAEALTRPLRGLHVRLLLEPGRSIIGPAGALLTRVTYRKKNDDKQFLIVDAAMNDLLRPSLYNAHHRILPVNRSAEEDVQTFDVVGPVCETGDFFARDRQLPQVAEGELLAILDTGAYGMVLASNYNSRTRPAEVLVDGKSARLIRRREKISDLLRLES